MTQTSVRLEWPRRDAKPIESLELSTRVKNALLRVGIATTTHFEDTPTERIAELVGLVSPRAGLGAKSLAEIEAARRVLCTAAMYP